MVTMARSAGTLTNPRSTAGSPSIAQSPAVTPAAAAFHESIAAGSAEACAEVEATGRVVLSGGTFQNLRLLASTRRRLESLGFEVLAHRLVPPNDGGISYGQAAVAAARLSC